MGSIVVCFLYYLTWYRWLPKVGGYQLRQVVLTLDDGTVTHSLIKVKNEELEAWEAKHDPSGRSLSEYSSGEDTPPRQ